MKQAAGIHLAPEREAALRTAQALLDQLRSQDQARQLHRSLHRLRLEPMVVLETGAIALLMTVALVLARPALMDAWQSAILWWGSHLGVPLQVTEYGLRRDWSFLAETVSLVPGPLTGVLTAAAVIAAFASTYWMGDRLVPLKYLVRTLCVVQASALLFFMFVPSLFPYTVGGHLDAMLESGYYLMLALPTLLAVGYVILRLPLHRKLLDPLLLLAYFAVMLPHKALLHVLVLQHFSVLFMPLLYLCFGLLFDLMLFVALYSWLVSLAPRRAVS